MKRNNCKIDNDFDFLVMISPILVVAIPVIISEVMLIIKWVWNIKYSQLSEVYEKSRKRE